MQDLLPAVVGAALVHRHVLFPLLKPQSESDGIAEFESSVAAALTTVAVLSLSCVITHLLLQHLLQPAGLAALQWPALVLVVPGVAGLAYRLLLQPWLRAHLPLVAGNGIVLGLILLSLKPVDDLLTALFGSAGLAAIYCAILLLFTRLMQRLESADIPDSFKGAPIALITAGLMLLAFMGLTGPG